MQSQQQLQQAFEQQGLSQAGVSSSVRLRAHVLHYFFSPAEEIDVRDRKIGSVRWDETTRQNVQVGVLKIPRAKITMIESVTAIRRSDETDNDAGLMEEDEKSAFGIAQELNRAYSQQGAVVLWSLTGYTPDAVSQIERVILADYKGNTVKSLHWHLTRFVPPNDSAIQEAHREMLDAAARSLDYCEQFYNVERAKLLATLRTGKGPSVASDRMKRICDQLERPTPDDIEAQIQTRQAQTVIQQVAPVGDGLERVQCGWCGEQVALINGNLPRVCKSCHKNPREAVEELALPPAVAESQPVESVLAATAHELPPHEFDPADPMGEARTLAEKEEAVFEQPKKPTRKK